VACEIGMTAEKVFARLDTNRDKKITVKEFSRSPGIRSQAEAKEAVGRIDTNKNGTLSWAELSKAYKIRHAKCPKPTTTQPAGGGNRRLFVKVFIMQNDKNGDGAVNKSEFRGSDERFDKMDKNSNEKLEADELTDLHNRRMQTPSRCTSG
jgi:Ca2+-binding EF-hand superfamily protein